MADFWKRPLLHGWRGLVYSKEHLDRKCDACGADRTGDRRGHRGDPVTGGPYCYDCSVTVDRLEALLEFLNDENRIVPVLQRWLECLTDKDAKRVSDERIWAIRGLASSVEREHDWYFRGPLLPHQQRCAACESPVSVWSDVCMRCSAKLR